MIEKNRGLIYPNVIDLPTLPPTYTLPPPLHPPLTEVVLDPKYNNNYQRLVEGRKSDMVIRQFVTNLNDLETFMSSNHPAAMISFDNPKVWLSSYVITPQMNFAYRGSIGNDYSNEVRFMGKLNERHEYVYDEVPLEPGTHLHEFIPARPAEQYGQPKLQFSYWAGDEVDNPYKVNYIVKNQQLLSNLNKLLYAVPYFARHESKVTREAHLIITDNVTDVLVVNDIGGSDNLRYAPTTTSGELFSRVNMKQPLLGPYEMYNRQHFIHLAFGIVGREYFLDRSQLQETYTETLGDTRVPPPDRFKLAHHFYNDIISRIKNDPRFSGDRFYRLYFGDPVVSTVEIDGVTFNSLKFTIGSTDISDLTDGKYKTIYDVFKTVSEWEDEEKRLSQLDEEIVYAELSVPMSTTHQVGKTFRDFRIPLTVPTADTTQNGVYYIPGIIGFSNGRRTNTTKYYRTLLDKPTRPSQIKNDTHGFGGQLLSYLSSDAHRDDFINAMKKYYQLYASSLLGAFAGIDPLVTKLDDIQSDDGLVFKIGDQIIFDLNGATIKYYTKQQYESRLASPAELPSFFTEDGSMYGRYKYGEPYRNIYPTDPTYDSQFFRGRIKAIVLRKRWTDKKTGHKGWENVALNTINDEFSADIAKEGNIPGSLKFRLGYSGVTEATMKPWIDYPVKSFPLRARNFGSYAIYRDGNINIGYNATSPKPDILNYLNDFKTTKVYSIHPYEDRYNGTAISNTWSFPDNVIGNPNQSQNRDTEFLTDVDIYVYKRGTVPDPDVPLINMIGYRGAAIKLEGCPSIKVFYYPTPWEQNLNETTLVPYFPGRDPHWEALPRVNEVDSRKFKTIHPMIPYDVVVGADPRLYLTYPNLSGLSAGLADTYAYGKWNVDYSQSSNVDALINWYLGEYIRFGFIYTYQLNRIATEVTSILTKAASMEDASSLLAVGDETIDIVAFMFTVGLNYWRLLPKTEWKPLIEKAFTDSGLTPSKHQKHIDADNLYTCPVFIRAFFYGMMIDHTNATFMKIPEEYKKHLTGYRTFHDVISGYELKSLFIDRYATGSIQATVDSIVRLYDNLMSKRFDQIVKNYLDMFKEDYPDVTEPNPPAAYSYYNNQFISIENDEIDHGANPRGSNHRVTYLEPPPFATGLPDNYAYSYTNRSWYNINENEQFVLDNGVIRDQFLSNTGGVYYDHNSVFTYNQLANKGSLYTQSDMENQLSSHDIARAYFRICRVRVPHDKQHVNFLYPFFAHVFDPGESDEVIRDFMLLPDFNIADRLLWDREYPPTMEGISKLLEKINANRHQVQTLRNKHGYTSEVLRFKPCFGETVSHRVLKLVDSITKRKDPDMILNGLKAFNDITETFLNTYKDRIAIDMIKFTYQINTGKFDYEHFNMNTGYYPVRKVNADGTKNDTWKLNGTYLPIPNDKVPTPSGDSMISIYPPGMGYYDYARYVSLPESSRTPLKGTISRSGYLYDNAVIQGHYLCSAIGALYDSMDLYMFPNSAVTMGVQYGEEVVKNGVWNHFEPKYESNPVQETRTIRPFIVRSFKPITFQTKSFRLTGRFNLSTNIVPPDTRMPAIGIGTANDRIVNNTRIDTVMDFATKLDRMNDVMAPPTGDPWMEARDFMTWLQEVFNAYSIYANQDGSLYSKPIHEHSFYSDFFLFLMNLFPHTARVDEPYFSPAVQGYYDLLSRFYASGQHETAAIRNHDYSRSLLAIDHATHGRCVIFAPELHLLLMSKINPYNDTIEAFRDRLKAISEGTSELLIPIKSTAINGMSYEPPPIFLFGVLPMMTALYGTNGVLSTSMSSSAMETGINAELTGSKTFDQAAMAAHRTTYVNGFKNKSIGSFENAHGNCHSPYFSAMNIGPASGSPGTQIPYTATFHVSNFASEPWLANLKNIRASEIVLSIYSSPMDIYMAGIDSSWVKNPFLIPYNYYNGKDPSYYPIVREININLALVDIDYSILPGSLFNVTDFFSKSYNEGNGSHHRTQRYNQLNLFGFYPVFRPGSDRSTPPTVMTTWMASKAHSGTTSGYYYQDDDVRFQKNGEGIMQYVYPVPSELTPDFVFDQNGEPIDVNKAKFRLENQRLISAKARGNSPSNPYLDALASTFSFAARLTPVGRANGIHRMTPPVMRNSTCVMGIPMHHQWLYDHIPGNVNLADFNSKLNATYSRVLNLLPTESEIRTEHGRKWSNEQAIRSMLPKLDATLTRLVNMVSLSIDSLDHRRKYELCYMALLKFVNHDTDGYANSYVTYGSNAANVTNVLGVTSFFQNRHAMDFAIKLAIQFFGNHIEEMVKITNMVDEPKSNVATYNIKAPFGRFLRSTYMMIAAHAPSYARYHSNAQSLSLAMIMTSASINHLMIEPTKIHQTAHPVLAKAMSMVNITPISGLTWSPNFLLFNRITEAELMNKNITNPFLRQALTYGNAFQFGDALSFNDPVNIFLVHISALRYLFKDNTNSAHPGATFVAHPWSANGYNETAGRLPFSLPFYSPKASGAVYPVKTNVSDDTRTIAFNESLLKYEAFLIYPSHVKVALGNGKEAWVMWYTDNTLTARSGSALAFAGSVSLN